MSDKKTPPEENARIIYADIIDLPHWTSPTHRHMSLYDRAAQFAPFAALSGYDDMVTEEARLVDNKIELDESEIENLNHKLELISNAVINGENPVVTITYFVKDPIKSGGTYQTIKEAVRKVDIHAQKLILSKKTGIAGSYAAIDIGDILELRDDIVD